MNGTKNDKNKNDKKIKDDIRLRISKLRHDANESQETIAHAIDIKRPSYVKKELGTNAFSTVDIINLANHFNVTADYILGLSNSKERDTKRATVVDYLHLSDEVICNIEQMYHLDNPTVIETFTSLCENDNFIKLIEDMTFLMNKRKE